MFDMVYGFEKTRTYSFLGSGCVKSTPAGISDPPSRASTSAPPASTPTTTSEPASTPSDHWSTAAHLTSIAPASKDSSDGSVR